MDKNDKAKKGKGCGGCFFFMVFIPLSLLFLLVLLSSVLFYVGNRRYGDWAEQFESGIKRREYFYYDGLSDYDLEGNDGLRIAMEQEELAASIETKIEQFNSVEGEQIRSMELDVDEAHYLIGMGVRSGISNNFELYRTYLSSEDGEWDFYYQLKFRGVRLPWVRMNMSKGEYERAYPRFDGIYVGEWDLDAMGIYFVRQQINDSVDEAYSILTENEWGDVTIENIELAEEGMYVRGIAE